MFLEGARRSETRIAALQALVAVRRYQLAHGSLPPDIESAVKEAKLAKTPIDSYSGQPLCYKVMHNQPVVYSVGSDQGDDGGTVDWNLGENPGDFIFKIAPPPVVTRAVAGTGSSKPTVSAGTRKYSADDLASNDPEVRRKAALQLGKMRPDESRAEVAKALQEILADGDDWAVTEAMTALRTWGDEKCVPAIVRVLERSRSTSVRRIAMETLGEFPCEESGAALAERVSDLSDSETALAELERMGAVAQKPLAHAMIIADPLVARRMSDALKKMAHKQAPSAETVTELIEFTQKGRDGFAMRDVIQILSKVKEDRVAKALATGLGDFSYRDDVAKSLVEFGPIAEPAVAEYLKHGDPRTREVACAILANIGTKKSIPALQALSRDFFTGQAARQAIDAINQRSKQKK
jgi:HEAT repeat protein